MKKRIHIPFLLICLFVTRINVAFSQSANDHIFPAAATAKPSIDFDARGFLINGKRTFLVSAGLEYARIPHQLWYDRLLRLKRAGFNCIEIYTFWNFHEPHDGVFDFAGDHDLDAFLKTVKRLNMYAIVRVGPYYCAEWDFGGYPIWLRFKDNLLVRQPNKAFEYYVDRFFDRLIPIVSNNQINHGGSVVLVQLENEHPLGWGTVMPNDYFKHLQSKALALGLQVPYFFSGLHHGSDPAGNATSFDNANRQNPWFSTEFWSVWYDYYGSSQKDADTYGRRTWKIIAHGGNGYNYYMAHGGTNFGYTNNNEDAASYDYGAAVGQTGDLRPIYYQFKRNAFFARTFQNILENSEDAGNAFSNLVTDSALKVNGRHSSDGDIAFLDNNGKNEVSTQLNIDNKQLPANGKLTLAPGEILPVVHDYQLAKGIKLNWAVARILGASVQGNTTTLVLYGKPQSQGYLQFAVSGAAKIAGGAAGFVSSGNNLALSINFNENAPVSYTFKAGGQTIRVLALSDKLADRTWFVDVNNKNYVITGPEYIAQTTIVNKHIQIETEHFWETRSTSPAWIFGEGLNKIAAVVQKSQSAHETSVPFSSAWQVKDASAAAKVNFDDQSWLKSKDAPQMGADNDLTADAWYRTTVNLGTGGEYMLKMKGGDRALVYVDDVLAASGNIHKDDFKLNLTPGKHTIAIFTAHDGRDKLFNYLGSIRDIDAKGILGEVILQQGKGTYVADWQMKPVSEADFNKVPEVLTGAQDYKIGQDAFSGHHGYAFFQARIPYSADHIPVALNFGSIDDNAHVFINGKSVFVQNGYGIPFSVPLSGILKTDGENILSVVVQNTNGTGGIDKPVEVIYNDKNRLVLNNWRMKGGPGNDQATDGWKPLNTSDISDRPAFYKNNFTVKSLNSNSKGMYRVTFNGLGHGSVWVNGYNIGRYPEKIHVNSLYIPECWLHAGANSIVIYDEDGKSPDKINISAETNASRDIIKVKF
ncbi:beta-galactosidase [Mucilaginibacter sp. SP1R1]|uniref:beta-galactosidase n=1 Tax=Mucilaginibacter sp. SP1R1 TaxID=2723091 RepID=UPI001618F9A1|nr:beta-galactosidase [Mucilaginibacter sp. SP1R1]MBB6147660.1 beta-galactosidase [Mucilaginibacter sp. SP1R1]